MDVAESDEFGIVGGDNNCDDKTVKKSPCFKNLNKTTDYLTSNAKQAFT